MDLEKDSKDNKKMSKTSSTARRKSEFHGRDLISYLVENLEIGQQDLATLLRINVRTLTNWANTPYDELEKGNLSLRAVYQSVYRMIQEEVPPSAIHKLLTGKLLDKEDSPTLIDVINEHPGNPLIEVTVENLIKDFKKKFYTRVSAEDMKKMNERFRLTDEQRDELRKKFKK